MKRARERRVIISETEQVIASLLQCMCENVQSKERRREREMKKKEAHFQPNCYVSKRGARVNILK